MVSPLYCDALLHTQNSTIRRTSLVANISPVNRDYFQLLSLGAGVASIEHLVQLTPGSWIPLLD